MASRAFVRHEDGHYGTYKAYMCNRYGSGGEVACSIHYINCKVLTKLLLLDIHAKAMLAQNNPAAIKEKILAQKNAASMEQTKALRATLAAVDKRLAELEKLVVSAYEDKEEIGRNIGMSGEEQSGYAGCFFLIGKVWETPIFFSAGSVILNRKRFQDPKRGGGGVDTDLLLIRKMKRGDADAVEEFVRKYYPKILQYCGIRMGPSYAEDLTQEVFKKFFRTFGQYRYYGKALNYLYVIAGNVERALKQMPPRVREVAILFFFQELKQAEVARILGISLPLLKYRIGKAREWLTAYFEEGSYETVGRRNQSV